MKQEYWWAIGQLTDKLIWIYGGHKTYTDLINAFGSFQNKKHIHIESSLCFPSFYKTPAGISTDLKKRIEYISDAIDYRMERNRWL